MTTSLVVERSEPGYGLPPVLSLMFIIRAGEEGEPGWGPTFCMGWWPASYSSIRGRRAFTSLAGEANFGYAGPANCGCRRPLRAWFPGLDGLGTASDAASCRLVGAWLSVHHTGDSRDVRRSATSTASPAPAAAPGGGTRRRTPRGGVRVLGWSCPHSHSEDGSKDLFARAGVAATRRYGTGAQVAAVVGAEVVAAAGEAPHCRGGCLRWRDCQCHLLPDLRLFGFNGLIVAPRRKTGARTFP
jgi:hypothetical protein